MRLFGVLIVGLVAGFVLACSRRKKKQGRRAYFWENNGNTA